jgi:hypothetical protein
MQARRLVAIAALGIGCAAVCAVSGFAAVNDAYQGAYTGPGGMGTDNLLAGVGGAGDTVTAFRTSRGLVCFEIKAAGTCGGLLVTWTDGSHHAVSARSSAGNR